jgi:KDO2-lipid IV(A) lauroyltransferase
MATPKFSHRAEALLVRAVLALFRALPPAAASNLGGGVARVVGPLIPTSKTADKNLRAAMPELDEAARRRIIRDVWDNLGRTVAELVHLGGLRETASGPGYYVTGWEHVTNAVKDGGPSIAFTGHIGNWEIIPPAAFNHGIDIGFMYRAASNPLVDDIILRLRESNFGRKVTMFPKGAIGARQAYAHIARMAMTAPALASFALKFRMPVFPVHVERVGPARLHVIFEPPVPLPESGDKEADVLALTTTTNQILERWIREKPGAWLWLHNRWPKGA